MAQCPQLSKITGDSLIITEDLADELLLSTDQRTVGTEVTVECYTGLNRVGPRTIVCQSNLKWSATPSCQSTGAESGITSTEMNQEDLAVIIGSAVGGLVVLGLIIFIIAVVCLGKKKAKENAKYREPEPYKEERSSRPYSISGQKPVNDVFPMYNMQTPLAIPTPYPYPAVLPMTDKLHSHSHFETPNRTDHIHCIHCREQEVLKRQSYMCPHCTTPPRRYSRETTPRPYQRDESRPYQRDEPRPYQRDEPRIYHRDEPRCIDCDRSLDHEIKDVVVRREIIRDGSEDFTSENPRKDVYIWRNMYDAGWRIPRPYYDYE